MHSQPDPDQILFIPPASHAAEEAPVTQAIILEDVFEPAAPAEASQEKGLSLFTHEVAPEAVHVQVQEEPPSLFAREIVPVTKEMTAAPAVPVREERPVPAPQLIPPTAAQERPLPPPSASQQPMFTQSGSDLDAKPVNTPAAVPSPPKFGPAAREWGRRSVPPQRPSAPETSFPNEKPHAAERAVASEKPHAVAAERPPVTRERAPASQEKAPVSKEKKAGSQERAPLTQGRAVRAAKGGDRYSFGVQMMRVSPAWLVVGGLAFVSLIALCTWLVKPGRADEELAAQIPARNQATNQRLADASKPPAQADTQTAAKLSEQKPTQTETAAAKPAEAKPAAEQKPAAESKPAESKPPQPAPAVAAKFKEDGKFTVQVGSFPEEALAQERVNRLKAAGFDGRVVSAQIPNRGIWYRVQAGRFGDRAEAGRYGSEIRSKGVADGAIVTEVQ